MRTNHLIATTIGLALLLAATATADVVTTTDGSRFVGTVEGISGGKVVIVTELAGRLEIASDKVTGVSTDGAVHVEVETGDTLVGPVKTDPDSDKSVVHSSLGEIPVKTSSITALWPEGQEHPEIVATREQAKAEIEAAKPKWTTTIEAGATYTEGNTDTLTGHGRLDIKRATIDDLLHFYLAGNYAEQNDKRSTNEILGGVRFENSITDRWYWYTRMEYEYDEFEGIDLRATASAGAGYYWLKEPDHELKTGIGAGYRHESYANGASSDEAVLDLGLDYRLDLTPWAQFTHSAVYSPDVQEINDYILKFDTGLVIPFQDDRFSWKIGMRNEYDSNPQSGYERLDNMYYTSLVLTLK